MARKNDLAAIGASVILGAALLLLSPSTVVALHNGGLNCTSTCHDISGTTYGQPDTSYIARNQRTLDQMIAKGFVPNAVTTQDFACTYCHSTGGGTSSVTPPYSPDNSKMKDVIGDFSVQTHRHPVGWNYASGLNTEWEWLGGILHTSNPGNLHCTGCHDPALVTVPDHSAVWLLPANKAVNPFGLREGNAGTARSAGNPATSSAEVIEFCSNLCHVSGPGDPVLDSGKNAHVARTSVAGIRGMVAAVADCQDCHASHFADQANLIPSTVASPSQCDRCHKAQTADGGNFFGAARVGTDGTNYYSGGHGKQAKLNVDGTLNTDFLPYGCTQCHDTGIPHDFGTENRIPWDESVNQCGICHVASAEKHPASGSLLCTPCHNQHGDGTADNMWMVKATIATPNSGNRAAVLTALSGPNSLDNDEAVSTGVCSVCHTATAHNANNTQDVSHLDSVDRDGTNCSTAGCHEHKKPDFRPVCDSCHGYPPPPAFGGRSAGAHQTHNAAPYGFSCSKCHSGYTHQSFIIDVNQVVEAQNPSWPALSYTALTGDTCDSTNCHNPYRVGNHDVATTNNPTWGATNGVGCVFCHNNKASNAHDPHLAKGYACQVCHETWGTNTAHVKGTLDAVGLIDFDTTFSSLAIPAPYNEGGSSCSNTYCHGNYLGGSNATPVWTNGATGACGTCHALTPTSGKHTIHLTGTQGPQAACSDCHGSTTGAAHVNGVFDLAGGTVLANTAVCDSCHGNDSGNNSEALLAKYFWPTAQPAGSWFASAVATSSLVGGADGTIAGGQQYCLWCHDANPSIVQTAAGTGGAARTAPNKETWWTANNGGHGHSGASTGTGNSMPGYDCAVCHTTTTAHIDATAGNNNRLAVGLNATNWCSECHVPNRAGNGAILGRDATVEASDHASAVTGRYAGVAAYNAGYACTVCHDVHGTSNIAMVNPTIVDGMGADATGVTLAAETGLDPDAGLDNGVCDRCHADGGQAHANTTNFGHVNNHNYGATCLTCHDHKKSFEGSCTACHGNSTSTAMWPDSATTDNTGYPDRVGRHPLHVRRIGERLGFGTNELAYTTVQQEQTCDFCHNDAAGVPGGANHETGGIPAEVGSFNQMWPAYAVDADGGYTAATYAPPAWTGGAVCNTVDCHLNKPTSGGYAWYGATTTACIMCHSDVTSGVVPTGLTHNSHMNTVANGLGQTIACDNCHSSATAISWGSPGVAPSANHINGAFVVAGSTGFAYTGAFPTPGSCGTNACHNNGQNAAPRTPVYTWGTAIANCQECHGETSTTIATQSHPAHLTTATGGAAVCADCHAAASVATHVNGTVNLAGLAYGGDVVVVTPGLFGGCGTNRCHNDGKNAAPAVTAYTWGTAINGPNSCTECHNATTTIATDSHPAHLTTLSGAGAQCADCHAAATVNTHGDGTVTLANKAANYPAANRPVVVTSFGGCGTNACHNDGKNNAPVTASYTWGTAINGPNSCTECHNATTGTLVTDSHLAHLTTLTGPGSQCATC
ncbi:MAG: CxxxxCH/CxxCH domain-containing protein, partial [Acidobacteria bacterium]|nr:CxxxxCH/CxxCH domain-containing protein [Acidobacteriota bacterium]